MTDIAKVDYNFGGKAWNLSVGRTDRYVIGGNNSYGYNYGDIFDRAELAYKATASKLQPVTVKSRRAAWPGPTR
mgnify:CR=1 FL=1